ncbi:MAG: DNA polymerase/3'-5' exonuclease PolX [Phycisphaerales bacterium]|nr:DNA polymerase/3'-5' exonuclease PolX [Phycisphaerales bacterium]
MNSELARAFENIADLLQITGADTFRVNSYRRVSRTIRDLADDVRTLHEAGVLQEVKGIGKGTAGKIEEFLETGRIALLDELSKEVPAGLPRLLEIPGLGPKTIALIHSALKVSSISDLKQAIASGSLAELPGLGAQSVKKIADGIAFLEASKGRTPRGIAWAVAENYLTQLRSLPDVERVEIAGSLRRGLETIGDVDLLCISDAGAEVVRRFTTHPGVKRVLAAGPTKGSIVVDLEGGAELQVDLRVVPAASFGATWQYFTGSKEHNVRLRERAGQRGWKLNEWGLHDGDEMLAGATEEEIYARLDLPCMPPEVREDREEFAAGAAFDDLVSAADIRGDLHTHTTASDGKNSIEEMAAAARALGYKYLAITDHSRSSTIANGLSLERMREHIAAIRAANARLKGFTLLVGCECDILPNGDLDYPDELLAECDWVVASIHAAMGKGGRGKLSPTERTLKAIANRYVCVIGHPTGRLINRREAMELDMPRIVAAAHDTGTALEVNASWQRLDLKDLHVRQAIQAGVRLCIDTDAHRTTQLAAITHGVATARRGWARRGDVLNTLPLKDLKAWVARKRRG